MSSRKFYSEVTVGKKTLLIVVLSFTIDVELWLGTMPRKPKDRRSLSEILQSTSDVLFPGELSEKQIDLHSRSLEGDTPLHVLLWRNDNFGIEVLIDAGADIDSIGDMDETPLHIAIRRENARATRSLLQAGAKTDIRSEFGETARELLDASDNSFKQLLDLQNDA
jgi:ankyrin repeat protein